MCKEGGSTGFLGSVFSVLCSVFCGAEGRAAPLGPLPLWVLWVFWFWVPGSVGSGGSGGSHSLSRGHLAPSVCPVGCTSLPARVVNLQPYPAPRARQQLRARPVHASHCSAASPQAPAWFCCTSLSWYDNARTDRPPILAPFSLPHLPHPPRTASENDTDGDRRDWHGLHSKLSGPKM